MEHGAAECVKEISVKTEVVEAAPSTAHGEIETNKKYIRKDAELLQLLKREPGLSVTNIVEDDWQDKDEQHCAPGALTPPVFGRVNVSSDSANLGDALNIKEEMADIDIYPTVVHQMDTHQPNLSVARQAREICQDHNYHALTNRVKEETDGDMCVDLQPGNKETPPQQQAQSQLYGCDLCPEVFKYKSSFNVHKIYKHSTSHKYAKQAITNADLQPDNEVITPLQQQAQSQLYVCDECPKVFTCKTSYDVHKKYKHPSETRKCDQCNKEFKCEFYLCNHVCSARSNQQHKCDVCMEICISEKSLNAHYRKFHGPRSKVVRGSEEQKHQSYRCNKCQKVFTSKVTRYNHLNSVHVTESHKCSQCNKEFKCKAYLAQHIRNTHSEQYECDRRTSADSSAKQVPGSEEIKYQSYKCNKCLKVFNNKMYLNVHIKRVHGTESHQCTQCNKEFKCKKYLLGHIRYTHRKRQFECDTCKKICYSRRALRTHVFTFHRCRSADFSSEQAYKCNKCLKVFKSKLLLNQHINVVHGTGSHKCTHCDKEFKCKVYLIRHIRYTHSKGQYECDICKKMCNSRIALLNHFSCFHRIKSTDSSSKHVHGSEEHEHKGYMCNKCMKVFKTEGYRNKHIRLVHGTELHKCTQCNKEFKCRSYLTGHIRYVHSKQQYECEICKKMCKSRTALYNHFTKVHRKKSTGRKPGNRGAASPSMVSSVSVAACTANPCSEPTIKLESGDTDLDIGPTVLQHVDSHFTLNQVKVEHMEMESSPLTDEQIVKIEPN